jgi:hypothetical protein
MEKQQLIIFLDLFCSVLLLEIGTCGEGLAHIYISKQKREREIAAIIPSYHRHS